MIINANSYSVAELAQMIDRRELLVNTDYQRGGGIWPEGPASYFIDTILENYPFPKIYLYEFLNKSDRNVRKEIVDGQQRIKTIMRFVNNEFALRGESRFAGKTFANLDTEDQERFLSYPVSVDVIRSAEPAEILQMFRRMNAFTLPLNEAEKRHSSFLGAFKWFINELADHLGSFLIEYGVLSKRQIVRMADAELLSEVILAFEEGVVSTSPASLRNLYRRHDDHLAFAGEYEDRIKSCFEFITRNLSHLRGGYMMKPYALQSLVIALDFCAHGNSIISQQLQIASPGRFPSDRALPEALSALAEAHEGKDQDGPHYLYVWGCLGGTNRQPRRIARLADLLRVMGVFVPRSIDPIGP